MLTIWYHLWRWLRFPVAIATALLVALLVWAAWLLSGQHYQHLLTQQLSALLGAQVSVASSRLSLHGGLGIQLDTVAVHNGMDAAPFFTADRIHLLLDLPVLLRGQLLFRRVDCAKPRISLAGEGQSHLRIIDRLREAQGKVEPADHWLSGWFSPTLALQHLSLRDGEILYGRESHTLVLTRTDTDLSYTPEAGVTVSVNVALGQDGEIGRVNFQASTPTWENFDAVDQVEWQGEMGLEAVRVQQLGRMLGVEWPQITLDLSGRYQGKWAGPVELTGEVKAGNARVGNVQVSEGRAKLTKVRWSGQAETPFTLLSFLRALVVEAQIEHVRGGISEHSLPVMLHKGDITLRNEELVATGVAGSYGTKSQITDATATLKRFFADNGPVFDVRMVASIDLEEGVSYFLTNPSGTSSEARSRYLTQPRGRALVRLGLQTSGLRGALSYEGEVMFQHAGFHLPAWNVDVADLSGSIRLNTETLATDALTLKVGASRLEANGRVSDYLTARRSANLRLTFAAARDQDVVPFLPQGLVLPQGGTLNGQVTITLPPSGGESQTNGQVALSRIRLEPLSFLRPIEVRDGELQWQGQSGTFTVKEGWLPGGEFSGRGRFNSFTPLHMELSADFADLNLESALALDKPVEEDSGPEDSTIVVRADLTSSRFTYKTMRAEDLRLSCHWHGRQADLALSQTKAAGGNVEGKAVLWPDLEALFVAPQVTQVDVQRFSEALGKPLGVITAGSLSGKGEIYMPDWHGWDDPARWHARLTLAATDGMVRRGPILVRLWSVLSMQELLSWQLPSLLHEGLAFSSFAGDLLVGKGVLATSNLSLSSSAVQIDFQGEMDLVQWAVDLKAAVVPLYGITSNVAKIPLAGKLLARGADKLTTLTFRVKGPYDDPTVTPLLVDRGKR
jgi:hypothetical protein